MSIKYHILLANLLLMLVCVTAEAQNMSRFRKQYNERMFHYGEFSYNAGVGISSYFGDLKENALDLWAKPTTQLGIQYRLNKHLQLRGEVMWYRISGADSLNDMESGIYTRNLSFRADNFELSTVAIWQFFNKYARYNRPTLNPYVFAGLALTTNNPKARYQDDWHALRPLQTEGVAYSSVVFAVPLGLGLTYHAHSNWDVSAEYGYRITFSDYLDDVSTTHLGIENISDPLTRALADRGPELPGVKPRPAGSIRGNNGRHDWYLITGLKVTYTPGPAARNKYRRAKYR